MRLRKSVFGCIFGVFLFVAIFPQTFAAAKTADSGEYVPMSLVEKAAWICNEHMLELPYCEKKLMDFHNYAYVDGWPDVDDPIWTLAAGGGERFDVTMIVMGRLKPAQ